MSDTPTAPAKNERWIAKNLIALLALVVSISTLVLTQYQRASDKRQEKPELKLVDNQTEHGKTKLTYENTSPIFPAAIHRITFTITDSRLLSEIEKRHPKPSPLLPAGTPETVNNVDIVEFRHGWWQREFYCFEARLSLHIDKAAIGDVAPLILDPKFTGMLLIGTFDVIYDGGHCPTNDVFIIGSSGE